MTIKRAVPNVSSDQPAETREFFVDLLGFEVAMDLGWVLTLASPTNPTAQVTIIGSDDPAAPGISVEVDDVDAVHAKAMELGLEIAYPLRDEEWGVRRFMVREPSGTTVNIVSHRSDWAIRHPRRGAVPHDWAHIEAMLDAGNLDVDAVRDRLTTLVGKN